MSRILAIDYGKKRTGIAVTDPMQIIASGLTTVATHELSVFIEKYLKSEDVETIVIGEPKQMDYTDSELGSVIHAFAKALQEKYPHITIERVDERFTSKMAFQTMIDSGLSKSKRRNKALVDEIAATIILQTFMDKKSPF
ncbi:MULTISPECIES: Holliday junction resolvase RuvX [Nonlabens]|uniref:Putative pre-16S rRNA nuclease n=1 Tax=Nonlabens ulvanivorans TaxID=906888 RepID=A0A081DDP7_NONUL|nr:Holliday junction resolvase RuvX [Nonlabens ulvanivorans]KEZ93882.1 Holliday junction resolvase [Nonlabens ulvanivorans]PRX14490.1 putative Holliday junction resolvase [Nonlabens ulvanivorans]WOI22971.1 Holliday junction resolvase RuvX [Nonlabens ulvanivorans]GAK77043.1 putative Holliday junction resolvase YggF [Nonlabens ulvanivorans]GAL00920.1 putative Holliday junction resolvase YggF [Nonlabens ulvanivorans]